MARILIVEDQAELGRLLAAVLEDAGFGVRIALTAKQALELLGSESFDGILLDLLLPDTFGFEVAREAKALDPAPAVIALSGVFRNDAAVQRALEDGTFDAFFEKPYRSRLLLQKLDELLPTEASGERAVDDVAQSDPTVRLDAEGVEGRPEDYLFDVPEGGLAAALAAESERVAIDSPDPNDGSTVTTGTLEDYSVPRLISAFYVAGESGELHVTRGKVQKVIYFHEGFPAFAGSNLRRDRFDELLLGKGSLDENRVRDAAKEARASGKRVDHLLLDRGLLSPDRYRDLVTEQVKQIVFSLFPWREGQWRMTFQHHAEDEPVRLEIFPADLILEGVQTLATDTLKSLIPDETRLAPAPAPAYQLYELELSGPQALAIARLDGTRTVVELAEEGWLDEHGTYALAYALLCLEVVEDASLLVL